MKFIGFYNYTVILTYMSLASSLCGMKFAHSGRFGLAICCLIISGVCDMFDGVVARTKKNRTADQKNFGIQLDSLCDVVCFGVFPAAYLYFLGIDGYVGIAILMFYVLCAVIRLAFFNVLEAKRQQTEDGCTKFYRGLPVTSAAMIFPLTYIVDLFAPVEVMNVVYHVVPVLVGFLFVADIKIPKLDVSKLFKKK